MVSRGSILKGIGRLLIVLGLSLIGFSQIVYATSVEALRFKPIKTQFIAALGNPDASSGTGAQHWGLWKSDPGPRGVWLSDFDNLQAKGGLAPAKWQFDNGEWWLDENGLLMEKPTFPMSPGHYVVTGEREVTTLLTVHAPDQNGDQKWELHGDARLYDVTHLPCRSARYSSINGESTCSPTKVTNTRFPIIPVDPMPAVEGCHKLDYSVLFVIGMLVEG